MRKDKTPLTFGKYKGKTPVEVVNIEPSYVIWMYENVKPRPCSKSLCEACEEACEKATWPDVFGHDCDQVMKLP